MSTMVWSYPWIVKKNLNNALSVFNIHWLWKHSGPCFKCLLTPCLPPTFFFFNFVWKSFFIFFVFQRIVTLQCCVSFWSTAKWISRTYIHIPSVGFSSHWGHHRALSRVLCGLQLVVINYVLFILVMHANPDLPIHPTSVNFLSF